MLRIDKIMKEHNINTLQLAEIMNVSPQYVSEVVNERKNITITQVPMASLVDGYHEKEQLGFNSFNCPYCGNVISIEKSDKR